MSYFEIKEKIKELKEEVSDYDKSIAQQFKAIEDNLAWIKSDQREKLETQIEIAELEASLLTKEFENAKA